MKMNFVWKKVFKILFLKKSFAIYTFILSSFMLLFSYTMNADNPKTSVLMKKEEVGKKLSTAAFAGGCFWCMEQPYESLNGIHSVVSGFMGGASKNPSYDEVTSGKTGHIESVQILYDPQKIQFKELLNIYWRNIDPTQDNGQFHDIGEQYRTVIFYYNEEQKKIAEESKRNLKECNIFKKPVVTRILPATEFFRAEEYHQDYYKKNPFRYKIYKRGSGRTGFLKKTWENVKLKVSECASKGEEKKTVLDKTPNKGMDALIDRFQNFSKDKSKLSSTLTPLQFRVTQKDGTEKPFNNKYWNNKEKGIYVDIVSGEPLFSSQDKYDSKTGWPSFTQPLDKRFIKIKSDYSLIIRRTEIRSNFADSHLGHLFKDGPLPTGLRYCINSSSLKFIPYNQLKEKGYSELVSLFN